MPMGGMGGGAQNNNNNNQGGGMSGGGMPSAGNSGGMSGGGGGVNLGGGMSNGGMSNAGGGGAPLGYGVTNTGTPGGLSMPGGTDGSGNPIPASQASNIYKLNIPFSTNGVTNLMGNPFNNFDTGFQVVGDGINWQDPANAGLLSQYTSPEAINNHINSMWAMSSANPNRDANMAAFIDSGHVESLITGKPPTAMPTGFTGLFNPAMTGLNTPWSQQYAAANGGNGGTLNNGTGVGGSAGGKSPDGGYGEAKNAKQALRIAGIDGNITRREAADITKRYGVNDQQLIKRLDALNSGLRERDNELKIGIGSNYVNSIIKNQPVGWALDSLMGRSAYGDGAIGKTLTKYRDAAYSLKPGEGMKLGNWDDRSKAYSSAGLIPLQRGGAYQLNSAGGYSPKVSNMSYGNTVKTPSTSDSTGTYDSAAGSGDVGTGDMGNPLTPEQMKEASTVPDSMVSGAGSALSSFATGFRSPQRGRQKAGRKASGYGSMTIRNAPGYASGVGLN